MSEFDIDILMTDIRERLTQKKAQLKEQSVEPQTPEEKLLRVIFDPMEKAGRSLILADPEELVVLNSEVERARVFVLNQGQDYTHHPSYPDMNPVFMTSEKEEAFRNEYWYAIGGFQLYAHPISHLFHIIPGVQPDTFSHSYVAPTYFSAEKVRPEDSEMGARFRMRLVDKDRYIYSRFHFNGEFSLQISFFDNENWSRERAAYCDPSDLQYQALGLPLTQITQEEAKIIQYYLRRVPRLD